MEEAKYSFSVPLPKVSQYDSTTQLTVRADHVEEFENSIDKLFGEGVFTKVKGLALQTILSLPTSSSSVGSSVPTGTGAAPANAPATAGAASTPAPAPAPAPQGGTGGASKGSDQESFGSCPQCGTGTLRKKFRRGTGEFWGVGCDNYPECGKYDTSGKNQSYMQYYANQR